MNRTWMLAAGAVLAVGAAVLWKDHASQLSLAGAPTVREQELSARVQSLSQANARLEAALAKARLDEASHAEQMAARQTEIAGLKARLASAPSVAVSRKAALTPQEAQARGTELRAAFDAAFAKKDGKAVLKALQDLLALGPQAYPEAAELWLRIQKDFNEGNSLGLSYPNFYQSMADTGFEHWALENPQVDASVRRFALGGLPWTDRDGAAAFIASLVEREQDPQALTQMAWELGSLADPATAAQVLAMAERSGLETKARQAFIQALGGFEGPEAERAVAALALDPDPDVRDAARVAGVMQHPPAAGIVLTQVVPSAQAGALGLKRGDILLSYNQKPLDSMETLGNAIHASDPGAQATLQVYRNGGIETLTLQGGRLGIDGRFVTPK